MFKRLIAKTHSEAAVPPGMLKASLLNPRLTAHHGIPGPASILAYDPVQSLLATGTRDGRIKVFGQEGVEVCLISPQKAPCRFLEFLVNKGCLIQATTRDDIEVWDLEQQKLIDSLKWNSTITAFSVAQNTNYIYLGSSNGLLNVLQYDRNKLTVLPYFIPPEVTMGGLVKPLSDTAPGLVGILPQPGALHQRLVLAYENGIIVLWDLHQLRVLATRGGTELQRARLAEGGDRLADLRHAKSGIAGIAKQAEQEYDDTEVDSEICCLSWACPMGSIVAAGYTDGEVALWAFPLPDERPVGHSPAMAEFSGVPLRRIQIATPELKTAVTLLKWCCDEASTTARGGGRLYIFGGGPLGMPALISVVSLKADSDGKPSKSLPWFGPVADILVVPSGSPFTASAVMVLTQPGQLHLWDEAGVAAAVEGGEGGKAVSLPDPIAFPFHLGASPVTATKQLLVENSTFINEVLSKLAPTPTSGTRTALSSGARWPISGGFPGTPQKDALPRLYFTGHNNGSVHLWDVTTTNLIHLLTAPANVDEYSGEADGALLHSVSALEFCPVSGLLVVAHDRGLVRLHILSAESRGVWRHTMNGGAHGTSIELVPCEPGFQCISVLGLHQATVTSIAIASGPKHLALGDEDGYVSIICLRRFNKLYHNLCLPNVTAGIVSMSFAMLNVGPTPSPLTHKDKPKPAPPSELVIFVGLANSTLVVLQAATGHSVGVGPLSTRHPATTIGLTLLDNSGRPISPLAGRMPLQWALEQPQSAAGSSAGSDSEPEEDFQPHIVNHDLTPTPSFRESDFVKDSGDAGGKVMEIASEEDGSSKLENLAETGQGEEGEAREQKELKGDFEEMDVVSEKLPSGGVEDERGGRGEEGKDDVQHGSDVRETEKEKEKKQANGRDNLTVTVEGRSFREVTEIGSPVEAVVFGKLNDELKGQPSEGTQLGRSPTFSLPTPIEEQDKETKSVDKDSHIDNSVPSEASFPHLSPLHPLQASLSFPRFFPTVPPMSRTTPFLSTSPQNAWTMMQTRYGVGGWEEYYEGRELWPEPVFMLLITEDCLRLYPTTVITQAERHALKKVHTLEGGQCIWVSTFGISGQYPFGIILISKKGSFEIRSLPDLAPVDGGPLSDLLTWPYEFASTIKQTAATVDGQMIMLAMETELARFSLFAKENTLGLPDSRPALHNTVLSEEAFGTEPKQSSQRPLSPEAGKNPLAKMIGGSLRAAMALANSVTAAVGPHRPLSPRANLRTLFKTSPFGEHVLVGEGAVEQESEEEIARRRHASLLGLDAEELGLPSAPAPVKLEPIVMEHISDVMEGTGEGEAERKGQSEQKKGVGGFFLKIKGAVEKHQKDKEETQKEKHVEVEAENEREREKDKGKGKDKEKGIKEKETEKDRERSALLYSAAGASAPRKPRTVAEIKASYGYTSNKATDAGGAAGIALNKLVERGEKLQELSDHTRELSEGAVDFEKLAEELMKREQNRKWWEFR